MAQRGTICSESARVKQTIERVAREIRRELRQLDRNELMGDVKTLRRHELSHGSQEQSLHIVSTSRVHRVLK